MHNNLKDYGLLPNTKELGTLKTRWPEELTGKNSVTPWTIPKMMAWMMVMAALPSESP